MKEQRYLLKHNIYRSNDDMRFAPGLDATNVKDKDMFYDLFRPGAVQNEEGTVDIFNREEIDRVIVKDWKLDYLFPRYSDEEDEVEFICDYHSWIGERPDRIYGDPVSKRMKAILEQFNIDTEAFYEAKVLFQDTYHDYFVWAQNSAGFDKYVDLEHSTFCEMNWEGELGTDIVKVESGKHIMHVQTEKKWSDWAFKRAVMKPEYKEIDCSILFYPYINVISERLKNALEAVEPALTGFEIKPFPIAFEYL
jgi:hypothetical protein